MKIKLISYLLKKILILEKLKKGQYKLEDIIENNVVDKILGKYQDNDLILKTRKFGLYVTWGDNKKSINDININVNDITLENVIQYITSAPK